MSKNGNNREPSPEGRELRRIREERLDYSQEEMARALEIRVRRLQCYESGETQKVPASLMKKAEKLKRA